MPADSIRPVLRQVFASPEFAWKEESRSTLIVRQWWRSLGEWLTRLEGDHPTLFQVLVWGLVLGLAAIALHAVWVLVRTTRARPGPRPPGSIMGAAEVRDAAWFAREAERLVRAGRYPAAIQAEFVRLSLELDGHDLLRFHPAKTPREYLAEARLLDPARAEFASLVRDLYRYAFGGQPCGPDEFAAWRARAASERYATQP